MTTINSKLMGIPEVFKDGNKVYFSYKKEEALFYYLLTKKQVSRDVVVNLLWGEVNEEIAKKNLRNAVYSIKKLFNEEVIISPKRSLLVLNPNINFSCDIYELFDNDESNEEIVSLYVEDFLEGFYVKDAESFEEWITQTREQYKEKYINKLTICTDNLMRKKDFNSAKRLCKKLVYIDEFNENVYRNLMNIYIEESNYGKALYTYNILKEKFRNELGVSPDEKTEQLYKEIIERKVWEDNNSSCEKGEFFYGRAKEVNTLMNNYISFIQKDMAKSIFIKGDAGIGKTRLVCEFINKTQREDLYVISTICYQAEEEYILKPWNILFEKISQVLINENIELPKSVFRVIANIFPTFNIGNSHEYMTSFEESDMLKYQAMEAATIDIINRICKKKRIILFFDDIQWVDQMSLCLIKNIILKIKNKRCIVLFTCRNGYDKKIDDFITFMKFNDLASEIQINPLTDEETVDFSKKLIPSYNFSKEEQNNIYLNTEGNVFFLVEYLNSFKDKDSSFTISSKMQHILKTRLYNISENSKRLLFIISIFFDMAKIEEIQALIGENNAEMIFNIDELQRKKLIKEVYLNGEIGVTLNHIKMREYVYSEIPTFQKIFLHKKVAEIIESKLNSNAKDFSLYSKLIYHYKGCGNKLKELEYKVKNLEGYLSNKHEVFPIIYKAYCGKDFLFTEEQVKERFKEIRLMIECLKNEDIDKEKLNSIEMEFFYMVGRDYIKKGEYEKGFKIICDLINHCADSENQQLILLCYKQVIYYSINIGDFSIMKDYVDKAIEVSIKQHYEEEIPIILRLKGYERIKSGKLEEGEKILKEAIELFNNLRNKEKYILNVAAAYDFIGESKMIKKQHKEALYYYELAISMCEERNIKQGLPIFYTNAGEVLYEMGSYDKAYNYVKKAMVLYEELNFIWGRDKVEKIYLKLDSNKKSSN